MCDEEKRKQKLRELTEQGKEESRKAEESIRLKNEFFNLESKSESEMDYLGYGVLRVHSPSRLKG